MSYYHITRRYSTINFFIPEKFVYDDDFEITPPDSSRDGTISYVSDNPEVAVVSGTTILIIGVGTCNIMLLSIAQIFIDLLLLLLILKLNQEIPMEMEYLMI